MSRRRKAALALVPAVAAATGVVGAADPAGAAQGDPLYGDVNADGITDRVSLVDDNVASRCGVIVQLGTGVGNPGSFGPPTTYYYPTPGTGAIRTCPDMGVIVDLGGDGQSELVLAWWVGRPEGVEDLLVLEDFAPAGGFDAIFQPQNIGTSDFNGDGLLDVYEFTDQGQGFRTYLNSPTGQLTPGPLAHSHLRTDDYELHDFDGDGATDVAFAFIEGSGPGVPFMGVAVVLDDGTTAYLENADLADGWDLDVVDIDHDGILDIRTFNGDTGAMRQFRGNGDGTFVSPK